MYVCILIIILEGISMSINLSSGQLSKVSMMGSLFLGLKEDWGLDLSVQKVLSSFLNCHNRQSFRQHFSNSLFNIAQSTLLAEGTNFSTLDNREILDRDRFLLGFLVGSYIFKT